MQLQRLTPISGIFIAPLPIHKPPGKGGIVSYGELYSLSTLPVFTIWYQSITAHLKTPAPGNLCNYNFLPTRSQTLTAVVSKGQEED